MLPTPHPKSCNFMRPSHLMAAGCDPMVIDAAAKGTYAPTLFIVSDTGLRDHLLRLWVN